MEIDILPKMARAQIHIVFIVVPRFNIATLITMIETLRIANYLAPTSTFSWEAASFDGSKITASNGIGRSLNRIVTNSKCLYGPAVRSLINIEMEIDMNSVQTNFITFSPTLEEIENRFITTIESGFNQCNIIEAPVKYILQFISFTDDKSLFGEFDSLLHQKHEETKSQISQLVNHIWNKMSNLTSVN